MDTNGYLKTFVNGFLALITVAATFKIVKILMDGQADGVPVKESLQKVKKILIATVLCLTIASLITIIKSYY